MDYLCCLLKPSGVGHWQRIIGNNCWFSTCPCNPSCVIMPLVLCVLLQSCYGNAFSCVYMSICIPKLLSPWSALPRVAFEQIQFRSSCHRMYIHRESWPLLIKSISHPVLVQRFNHISQRNVRRQNSCSWRECLGASVVEVNYSWVTYLDSAEPAFISEDVCLEDCKYSKMSLLITRVVLVISP